MSAITSVVSARERTSGSLETLDAVQRRVRWLAVSIVHHANKVRPNRSGVKVGGHQASSASMVSMMSALYFQHLDAADRVSVKPHAAPVLHAIEYLLGRLDAEYLTELRSYGGLQSYPSRLKDPFPVDFSTGSVGIGATPTIWSSLAHRYVSDHFDVSRSGRHIALVGDAELDEGACWEAIVDPMVPNMGDVMWVVDMNRQSLDRVVPEIAVGRIERMFESAGWHSVTVKYGSRLGEIFSRPGGEALRRRIDRMSNEEYQRLLRADPEELRVRLPREGSDRGDVRRILADLDDRELHAAVCDLGGHDLGKLLDAYREADAVTDRPSVIFAYTVKGWKLPVEGHPGNHSALLRTQQWEQLAVELGADAQDPWRKFEPGSEEEKVCLAATERLERGEVPLRPVPAIPTELSGSHSGMESTQQAFGRLLTGLGREAPEVARHVVTVSPDVASSTNLGGWINKVGIWNVAKRRDWFADDAERVLRWREGERGQHIELGIAEANMAGLLSELGLTWSRDGQPLLPVGTLYDPFVTRTLEPWAFGIYAGGQSILVGTPSGVTLAPEGGAHQSVITPSIGLEQPGCVAWEPAFCQDLEWSFLHALGQLGRPGGTAAYFRLSTRLVDQNLAALPSEPEGRDERRRRVLEGGYRLREASPEPDVTLVGVGAMMTEVLAAADELEAGGVQTEVVCLTSPDLVFRAIQARQGLLRHEYGFLDTLFPPEHRSPFITVLDGHPHTLSFLAAVRPARIACLGVSGFGQSGDLDDLYRHFAIDADTIVGAALDVLEL